MATKIQLQKSEDKIVTSIKETFNEYDKKFSEVNVKLIQSRKVQRRHSADITELKAVLGD